LKFVDIVPDIEVCQYPRMPKVSPCCPPLLHGDLTQGDAEELAATLKALADPVRLRILSLIAAQPESEACVCHITSPSGLSQPTMSHHLKLLHGAGLLEREKRGAWVYYRIVPARLEAVRAALATRTPRGQVASRRQQARRR
jgi:ArsR family transcriptional regulator